MNQFYQREENKNYKAKSKIQKEKNFYEGHDLLKSNQELR